MVDEVCELGSIEDLLEDPHSNLVVKVVIANHVVPH